MKRDSHQASGAIQRSDIVRALTSLTFVALVVAVPAKAQDAPPRPSAGNGFLFHEPTGTFSLRGGYSRANAGSDLFALQEKQLTIGPRGFDALSLGLDLGFNVSRRLDVGVTLDGTTRSHGSEYRNFLDNNNQPIKQTTSLSTVGLSANLKYDLQDRGRAISNFAWIPSHYVPYVGVGAGVIRYDFTQKGDFIDFQTNAVNSDQLNASNWGAMAQLFSGLSYTLSPRWSLLTEARYTLSSASLNKDYTDLGRIDLSGLSLNVGTSIRF
jgi:opacity protein-like surface antigen